MAIIVAPLVDQLNVVLVPEFTLVGFAEKEEMVGADPFPGGGLTAFFVLAQPTRPRQVSRMRSIAQRVRTGESGFRRAFCLRELVTFMRDSFNTTHQTSLVSADLRWLLVARAGQQNAAVTKESGLPRVFQHDFD
jgi:hypothetical protein